MNQKLLIALNELLASSTPTRLVERGNAFSIADITDIEVIKNKYEDYKFEGLNIYSFTSNENTSILNGECFFSYKEKEIELYAEVQINEAKAEVSCFEIETFEINRAEDFLLLILKANSN